jgi:23S rRNA pseudouridine2457 synthase
VLIAFYKPYGVLSQFTPEPGSRWGTLADFGLPPEVYALGRLDADSEGLLLFSDEPELNHRLLDPTKGHRRCYWVLVERIPTADALAELSTGIALRGEHTRPCRVRPLATDPELPPRDPPVRFRKNVPDCWLSLELTEGKNRQVRRMTAAIGHPTLRLHRAQIGNLALNDLRLSPGQFLLLDESQRLAVFTS